MNYSDSLVLIWFIYIAWLIKTFACCSQEHILRPLSQKGLFPLWYLLRIYMLYSIYVCVCMLSHFSHVRLCNPMDCSPPVSSMGFSRQEYWSGLPFPPLGGLPDPETKPAFPALAGGFFTTKPPRKPILYSIYVIYIYTYIYTHAHGESHRQKSLAGYSSWGHKESDMT